MDPRNRWFPPEFREQYGDFSAPGKQREYLRAFGLDQVRSDMLALLLREVVEGNISGSLAELGVHRGASARLIHRYLPERRIYLLDTFEGFNESDLKSEDVAVGFNKKPQFSDTSIELVRTHIQPVNDNLTFVQGWFPASATEAMRADTYSFVHIDADLEAPITAALDFFWPRLSQGGIVAVHDYNAWPGARAAVIAFRQRTRALAVPMPDKSGSIVLRKV